MTPRLLDLFCGCGGCSVGYARAGFSVVGVDINRQPHYPFEFIARDALAFLRAIDPAPTRDLLAATGLPYVIENVVGADMPGAVTYCGSSFGLRVRRHRLFESNVPLTAPACDHASQPAPVGVYGNGGAWTRTAPGGGGVKVSGADAADALGIGWTDFQPSLSQAIPPAYTEHIGRQLLAHLSATGGAS